MATPELVLTPEGILTAKEGWAVAKGTEYVRDKWLNEISKPRREEREKKDVEKYINELRALNEEREAREAELIAVREHARKIGEITLQLQRQAEEREQEQARTEQAAAELEQTFRALAEEWNEDTMFSSSVSEMVLHPAYLQIIGLGPAALPLILRALRESPDHWFVALKSISREDPVKQEDLGHVERMVAAWLQWGEGRGYI